MRRANGSHCHANWARVDSPGLGGLSQVSSLLDKNRVHFLPLKLGSREVVVVTSDCVI
jgi:hypothetical protein